MVVLGLLLIIVAAAVGTDIAVENTSKVDGSLFQQTVSGLSLGGVFLTGAVTALVLLLGLWMLLGAAARKRRKRKAVKQEVQQTVQERESLAQQNDRLARQLEEERRARGAGPVAPYDGSNPTAGSEPVTGTSRDL